MNSSHFMFGTAKSSYKVYQLIFFCFGTLSDMAVVMSKMALPAKQELSEYVLL